MKNWIHTVHRIVLELSSVAKEPVTTLVSKVKGSAQYLPTTRWFDADSFLLRRKMWHGEEIFVSRFTTSISLPSRMSTVYENSIQWRSRVFSFEESRCKPVVAHCNNGSEASLMLLWSVRRFPEVENVFWEDRLIFRAAIVVERVVRLPNFYYKICVISFPTCNYSRSLCHQINTSKVGRWASLHHYV